MNLASILSDAYDILGYKNPPETAVTRRLTSFANASQRELVTMRGLARLRRSITTFQATAGSPFATLPQSAVRIAGITERGSQRYLQEKSIQQLRSMDPGLTNLDANPWCYIILNMTSPTAVPIQASSEVFVQSDSPLDIGTAFVKGIVAGGYPRTAQVTMAGVTPLPIGGGVGWVDLSALSLSLPAVGNVTFTLLSGAGVEVARIAPGKQSARYTLIQLYGTPSQALTYHADIDRAIDDFVNDSDEPYLPEDFHWLITAGVCKKEFLKRGPDNGNSFAIEQARWREGVSNLKGFCRSVTDGGGSETGDVVDFNSRDGQIWAARR